MRVILNLKPFQIPNFVTTAPLSTGDSEVRENKSLTFSLSEIDPQALSDLCDQFRRAIFDKAKKKDPKN